jgi:hypothetical protein
VTDTEILDWLCMQYVTVRIPLRYGSLECFMASPEEQEADYPAEPSDLREKVKIASRM